MRAEWGVPLEQALYHESLNAALALWPAMLLRHGVDPGSTYVERARQRAKEEARRWIHDNYTVLPSEKKPTQTLLAADTSPINFANLL